METRIEAQFDSASGVFSKLVENTKGPRDSTWPGLLNTLLDDLGSPILPPMIDGNVQIPDTKLLIVNDQKSGWEYIDDIRGKLFRKSDGSEIIITDSNIRSIDISTLIPTAPNCPYPTWDDATGVWIIDNDRMIAVEDAAWDEIRISLCTMPTSDARSILYRSLQYKLLNGLDSGYDRSQPLCVIDGETLNIDQANQLWLYYIAEGDTDKATTIKTAIAAAKTYIRSLF